MVAGNGATDDELAEVAFLASLTARWSAMLHALQYNYDTFTKEVHQIGEHAKKTAKKQNQNCTHHTFLLFEATRGVISPVSGQ
jgi:hypothetical protein